MKDQAPTLLKKIRNKETMPTHWYSCKRIRHRMGTGVERLKEIDAANLKFITCFFCALFSCPINDKLPCHVPPKHDAIDSTKTTLQDDYQSGFKEWEIQ